jgi:hypothetical protein
MKTLHQQMRARQVWQEDERLREEAESLEWSLALDELTEEEREAIEEQLNAIEFKLKALWEDSREFIAFGQVE